jgi:hypothetical protein
MTEGYHLNTALLDPLKSLLSLALVLPVLLFAQQAVAAVSSADVPALVRALEQDPLAPDARQVRAELLQWATDTQDVSITVCAVLGPIPGNGVPNGPELLAQAMFANGAFKLEHPGQREDEVAAQLAGIASLLRAYEKLLAADPGARIPEFDTWLLQREDGTLAEQRTPSIIEKCLGSGSGNPPTSD